MLGAFGRRLLWQASRRTLGPSSVQKCVPQTLQAHGQFAGSLVPTCAGAAGLHRWQPGNALAHSTFSARALASSAGAAAARPDFPQLSEPLKLNNISDNKGARTKRKRVGRGIGSGRGKTCGRGHKGQKSRSGGRPRLGFEGGQTPLRLRLPKRGFHNPHSREYQWLNLYKLDSWIRQGRIDPAKLITMKTLRDTGAVGSKIKDGVKLLGGGHADFSHKISIEVTSVSELARHAVERAGGEVRTVYYNKLGLKALMTPHRFEVVPFPARPPPKLRHLFEYVGRLPEPKIPMDDEKTAVV